MKPIRAAIVYHYIAHYREPIFRLLCSGNDRPVSYHAYASVVTNEPALKVLRHDPAVTAPELVARWTPVENHWILGKLLWQPAVVALAASRRCDCLILLGNAYFLSSWLAAVLGRITGKRVLMWTHGYLRRDPPLKRLTRYAFYRLAHGLLLYGNRGRTILREIGYADERMYVVYNSLEHDRQLELRARIDAGRIQAMRRELGIEEGEGFLLSVGRMNRAKRYDELVAAVAHARAEGARLRLVLVGDGPERAALEAQARQLALTDCVTFYGPCYEEERLAAIISAADLFVMAGDIGLSCIHAFAYGVPVVTHDGLDTQNPELEALQPGRNGDLFREHDVADLARVIGIWLERMKDPAERRRAAAACTEVVDRFFNAPYQREVIDAAVRGCPPPRESPGGVIESPRETGAKTGAS